MKIVVNNKVFDADKQPIAIVFDDDYELKQAVKNLTKMQPKIGRRIYLTFPNMLDGQKELVKVEELLDKKQSK